MLLRRLWRAVQATPPFAGLFVGTDSGGISFGDVVALRTRFGSDDIMRKTRDETIGNVGVWAGDAFDITTLDEHERREHATTESWRDASEEVAHEMETLWEKLNNTEY